jgi:hypothetical protein
VRPPGDGRDCGVLTQNRARFLRFCPTLKAKHRVKQSWQGRVVDICDPYLVSPDPAYVCPNTTLEVNRVWTRFRWPRCGDDVSMSHKKNTTTLTVERFIEAIVHIFCLHLHACRRDGRKDLKIAVTIDHDRRRCIWHQKCSSVLDLRLFVPGLMATVAKP